jgi:hypothetical protein
MTTHVTEYDNVGGGGGVGGGSGLSWNTYFRELTDEDATNKYFDLSENVHSAHKEKVILTVETDIQAPTEYEVIVDSEDRLRRISWAGRGLETDPPMQAGWRCWVWYPVQQ